MIKNILYIVFVCLPLIIFLYGCANQLPPTGGDDDTSPPKVLKIIPLPNTLNYSGKKITVEFNEYIDRRSFKESLFISPKPLGELEYKWSGTKVEIEFPRGLSKNTTYSFMIGKGLKDIYNNSITAPIQFAFSTGNTIDNGKIGGKVFSPKSDNLLILAYLNRNLDDSLMNPTKQFPDFFTQVDENSKYFFNHLPIGKFRLFALKDNNRNLLFDIGADEIAVLNSDIVVEDSISNYTANFLFPNYFPDDNFIYSEKFLNTLIPDSSNRILSSLKNNSVDVPIDSRYLFYFKNNKLSRFDIAESIKLIDTINNKNYRLHFNWYSDSILEIIPTEILKFSTVFKFIFDIKIPNHKLYNELIFNTADERKTGSISGAIINFYSLKNVVYIKLNNQSDNLIYYSKIFENDSLFSFKQIPEGQYLLFSFIDEQKNRVYDFGNAFPFKPSEKFFIFEPILNLKGGWKIENVSIKF